MNTPHIDRRRAIPRPIPSDRLKTIATKPSAVLQSGGQVRLSAGELMTLAIEASLWRDSQQQGSDHV